ncbi:hypothetical protein A606_08970 [Corynebacterium terpenotabidum Y-11]|uniref:J domain-containing protein n=2 Tax=Corynebacterium terpenotabidum TaxID=89154 RepID=S4XIB8_9CORY|nr:hypothetical protein A606_08970 [Corynebacterium terpenotabidum Y-11]
MPNYDLYTELALDKDMPPAQIGALLEGRINTLLAQGYPQNSPEVDQLATARAILSDPAKRNTYEAALSGPDGVITVSWLHGLADSAPYSAHDAAPTSVIAAVDADAETSGDAASDGSADSADSAAPAEQTGDEPTPEVNPTPYLYGGHPQQNRPQPAPMGYGPGSYGPAQGAPATSAMSQFDMAALSVAGRVRAQSKAYLACLAVMVVGMIYPLIVLFTAGAEDFTDIFKALLFAVAHTVAWVGIAEIIWGVRRIVAPEETTDSTGSRPVTQ